MSNKLVRQYNEKTEAIRIDSAVAMSDVMVTPNGQYCIPNADSRYNYLILYRQKNGLEVGLVAKDDMVFVPAFAVTVKGREYGPTDMVKLLHDSDATVVRE